MEPPPQLLEEPNHVERREKLDHSLRHLCFSLDLVATIQHRVRRVVYLCVSFVLHFITLRSLSTKLPPETPTIRCSREIWITQHLYRDAF